jgi:hypothetical protein
MLQTTVENFVANHKGYEILGDTRFAPWLEQLPQYNLKTLAEYLRLDGYYREQFVWYDEKSGVPIFVEEQKPETLRLWFDDLTLTPTVPFSSATMVSFIEKVSRHCTNRLMTLPSLYYDSAVGKKFTQAYASTDKQCHLLESNEAFVESLDSKSRYKVKKATKEWLDQGMQVTAFEANHYESCKVLIDSAIASQSMYWKSKKALDSDQYEYVMRLLLWQLACMKTGLGVMFLTSLDTQDLDWLSMVGLTLQCDTQGRKEFVYSTWAQNPHFTGSASNIGVASLNLCLNQLRTMLNDSDLIVRLSTSSDEFIPDAKYLDYKKALCNAESGTLFSFASSVDEESTMYPPYYDCSSAKWILK